MKRSIEYQTDKKLPPCNRLPDDNHSYREHVTRQPKGMAECILTAFSTQVRPNNQQRSTVGIPTITIDRSAVLPPRSMAKIAPFTGHQTLFVILKSLKE